MDEHEADEDPHDGRDGRVRIHDANGRSEGQAAKALDYLEVDEGRKANDQCRML